MDNDSTLKYKDMSVEEIITDLYERGNEGLSKEKACAARWLRIALVSFSVCIGIVLFQLFGHCFEWGWIFAILCFLITLGCCYPCIVFTISCACANKCAESCFLPLIERAIKIKYGQCDCNKLEEYVDIQFIKDFIAKHNTYVNQNI